jgi:hypothetical protein
VNGTGASTSTSTRVVLTASKSKVCGSFNPATIVCLDDANDADVDDDIAVVVLVDECFSPCQEGAAPILLLF